MERHRKHIGRGASLGLVGVLIVLSGFAEWTAQAAQQIATHTRTDVNISQLYDRAQFQIGDKQSLDSLQLAPRPASRVRHIVATLIAPSILMQIRHAGAHSDQQAAERIWAQQQHYLVSVRRMFAAVDAHQPQRGILMRNSVIVPMLRIMRREVERAASAHRQRVQNDLAGVRQKEMRVVVVTPIVFGIGLMLLVLFWTILRRFQREKDVAREADLVRLEHAVRTDPLTTLGNHRAFEDAFNQAIGAARREGDPVCMARVDIDEFKYINDQNGHLHGDAVLAEMGMLLHLTGHADDLAFRLGGDEFALLLPHTTLSGAEAAMERLRMDAERRLSGATLSIGIAAFNPPHDNPSALSAQSDAALYEAKRRGRNVVATFAQIQGGAVLPSSAKDSAVRNLIREREVRIAFQPIWSLSHGLAGYEALARPAPQYELAGPQEAFDIAERMGRAHELDVVCVHAVLARARELPPDTLLFINLSPQSLDHDLLSGPALLRAAESADISPDRVVFEITERSAAPLSSVIRQAKRLRELRFKVALDDVGAGNSGLELLSQLPVDFVKIDRAVVGRAVTDITADAVLSAILAFAGKTGSAVIVEGIETEAALRYVSDAGAEFAQGYLLGRPSEVIPALTTVPKALSA